MLDFQFLPIYIKSREFNKGDIRIEIIELPCQNPNEEEYRFRMKSRHKEEEIIVHRDIAIEHHQPRETHPHGSEHLQFKLYTEGFGKIRITLDIRNNEEYKRCILGFLSVLKDIIDNFDKYYKNIIKEILNLEMFGNLKDHRNFLKGKISDSLIQSRIEMDTNAGIKVINKDLLKYLRANEALLPFFEGIKI
ncbi:MAG: hypothetical protein KKC75_05725 [Nanoarchaeota archaeon]|nr:hypothetical protein [Nanoarchaeota archaeon]MBU1004925.1 hypothetical protein [Nanoarchaeota archaeon]MBU1945629.1 hypothetical protein [Nanoarchaeota archaeon]